MMQYKRLRAGSEGEVLYNFARFFDHVGQSTRAVSFYEQALAVHGSPVSISAQKLHIRMSLCSGIFCAFLLRVYAAFCPVGYQVFRRPQCGPELYEIRKSPPGVPNNKEILCFVNIKTIACALLSCLLSSYFMLAAVKQAGEHTYYAFERLY